MDFLCHSTVKPSILTKFQLQREVSLRPQVYTLDNNIIILVIKLIFNGVVKTPLSNLECMSFILNL